MTHAWRVMRYHGKIMNDGFAQFLADTSRPAREELLRSLGLVGQRAHVQTLQDAIAYQVGRARGPRILKEAWIARMTAYDSLSRGWSREKTIEAMASLAPECSAKHYDAVLTSASLEFNQEARWQALDQVFFDQELGLCESVAAYAERHPTEWRSRK
jgi:Domain of unknown function (DUF4375)